MVKSAPAFVAWQHQGDDSFEAVGHGFVVWVVLLSTAARSLLLNYKILA